MASDHDRAPKGQLWVCGACGKRSRNRSGTQALDPGWDSSCRTWAVLCQDKKSPEGTYVAVTN